MLECLQLPLADICQNNGKLMLIMRWHKLIMRRHKPIVRWHNIELRGNHESAYTSPPPPFLGAYSYTVDKVVQFARPPNLRNGLDRQALSFGVSAQQPKLDSLSAADWAKQSSSRIQLFTCVGCPTVQGTGSLMMRHSMWMGTRHIHLSKQIDFQSSAVTN